MIRILLSIVILLQSSIAMAQKYPIRPIRLIVSAPPGGGGDITVRVIADKLSKALGQPVVVVNKPGASTMIGTEEIARAAPDGYTFGMVTDSHSINPYLFKKIPYDSQKAFTPITQIVKGYWMLASSPNLNFKTLAEFVNAAKASPGKMSYASAGNGSPHHLTMELLKQTLKIDLFHVPYKGAAPATNDVTAGHVSALLSGPTSILPLAENNKLNALAVTSPKRLSFAPKVPTLAESGYPDFVASFWYGFVGPAGMPSEIVLRLNQEVHKVLSDPIVQSKLNELGLETVTQGTPEEFGEFMRKDALRYQTIVKNAGIKGE